MVSLGTLRLTRTHRVRAGVRHAQLAGLARLQARSALQELVAELARGLNQPEAPVFAFLRERLVGDWGELDLTPALPRPEIEWQPSLGRLGEEGPRGHVFGEVLGFSARLHGATPAPDPAGSEEYLAVVTLAVDVRVRDAHGALTRHMEESYELRATLVGPPRPFDQLGLFAGELGALTDVSEARGARRQLLDRAATAREELAGRHTSGWPADLAAYLGRIVEGMPAPEALADRVPRLPDEPAALTGFHHVDDVPLETLDLAAATRADRLRLDELARAYRGAGADPQAVVDAAYAWASALSNAADRLWRYQYVGAVLPHGEARYRAELEPFLGRLEPGHWLARAHLAGTPDHPDLAGWLAGENRLEGVVDMTATRGPVVLAGPLEGRVAVLVGERGARLEGVRRGPRPADKLLVVSFGGDVEVAGDCAAAVLMLAPREGARAGRLTIPGGATLRGAVLAPHAGGDGLAPPLELRGTLVPDARLLAPWPPAATVHQAGAGSYVLALDPRPLWGAGEAR